jgi:hypothetical protein
MPNARSNLKLTGDTHLPDVESDLDVEEGISPLARLAQERGQSRRPLVRRAGVLLAPDSDAGPDPTAGARDAGSSRQTLGRDAFAGRLAPGESEDRDDRGGAQPQQQPRAHSPYGVWLVAVGATALLVKLLR